MPEFEGQYAAFKKTLPDTVEIVDGGLVTTKELAQAAGDKFRAAQVRRRFRDTNLAQIGRPYPGMMDLYIDETNLYHRMFLYTKQFDWEKMWAIADNITDEDAIRAKAQDILDTFDIEGGGTIEKVWEMAKYVVAEGINEEGPIFTFGDTNMRTRFTCGAWEFCNKWSEAGSTHHMAAASGRHIDTILKVAKIFNVPVDVITR